MKLNRIIRTIKPIQIMVLSLNAHLIPWIWIILFITAHFVMKMNLNDVLCQKTVTYLAAWKCPMSTRATAGQIILHEGCFDEEPHHKKLRHSKLSKLDPQAYRFLVIMFYKCIIDRRKSCFDFNAIIALSLLGRFYMSVQLHFLNFLWEPS